MQALGFLQIIGILSIIIGISIFCFAVMKMTDSSDIFENETKTQHKGVILIGPIPIVWGYGKKGWAIAAIIGIVLFIVVLIFLS